LITWLYVEQPAAGEPDSELLRCSYSLFDDRGVDLETADLVGVARMPEPNVFDPQYGRTLLIGYRVPQRPMPRGVVLVKIVQPQRQVEAPNAGDIRFEM
jgi:hypothetical protein